MRERLDDIKFRVRVLLKTGERQTLYVTLRHLINYDVTLRVGAFYLQEIESVDRYTGLKDWMEKEIYEGDIVKDTDSGHIGKVVWLEYKFTINMDGEDWPFYVINGKDESVEVIGNIYKDPGLLEEAK